MWKTICREIWCSRSVTNAVVRKKVLREKTTQYGRRAMKTTDFSRQASVFLLHFDFIFPKPTFQMCPRLAFLRLKFTPSWEKRPQRRASFELGPKGGIISFSSWTVEIRTSPP
ncbi:unnamed protein product [Sphagnum balticum]